MPFSWTTDISEASKITADSLIEIKNNTENIRSTANITAFSWSTDINDKLTQFQIIEEEMMTEFRSAIDYYDTHKGDCTTHYTSDYSSNKITEYAAYNSSVDSSNYSTDKGTHLSTVYSGNNSTVYGTNYGSVFSNNDYAYSCGTYNASVNAAHQY